MDNNNDNLINDSINTTERKVEESFENKVKNLQNAANQFLQRIQILSGQKNKQLNDLLEKDINDFKEKYIGLFENTDIDNGQALLSQIYNDQVEMNKKIQEMEQFGQEEIRTLDIVIEACFEFQAAINKFLNITEIIMTWITPEGEIYHLSLEYEKYLLRKGKFEDKKFNLPTITQSSITKQKEKVKEEITKQKIKSGHQKKIYNLYKAMQKHQDINKKKGNIDKKPAFYESYYKTKIKTKKLTKDGKYLKISKKPDLFFAMQLDSSLNFKFVSNWGVLREAYYAALMDDNVTFDGNQNEQANKLYEKYIKKVDNKGGVLGGDVSVVKNKDSKTTIDYAVKTGSAKSQSFLQYFTIAQEIIKTIKTQDNSWLQDRDEFNKKIQGETQFINGKVTRSIKSHLTRELKKLNIKDAVIS